MADDALMAELAEVAARQGLSWRREPWPGRDPFRPGADNPEDLTHELAHWMVALPHERTKPWFGLGNPSGFGPAVYKPHVQVERECAASLLGIALLWWLTADRDRVNSVLAAHDWSDDGPAAFRLLRRRGMVAGRSLWESWPGPRWEASDGD